MFSGSAQLRRCRPGMWILATVVAGVGEPGEAETLSHCHSATWSSFRPVLEYGADRTQGRAPEPLLTLHQRPPDKISCCARAGPQEMVPLLPCMVSECHRCAVPSFLLCCREDKVCHCFESSMNTSVILLAPGEDPQRESFGKAGGSQHTLSSVCLSRAQVRHLAGEVLKDWGCKALLQAGSLSPPGVAFRPTWHRMSLM
jgi:hypothetical protein